MSTHSLNILYLSFETLTNLATYCIISVRVAIVPLWTRLTSRTKPTLDIFQRIPDKLDLILLYRIHLTMIGIRTHNFCGDRH
jgi:hypothetical protein